MPVPGLRTRKELKVARHISGGVAVQIGEHAFVLPAQAAVGLGEALLVAAGREVRFAGGEVLIGAAPPVIFNQ